MHPPSPSTICQRLTNAEMKFLSAVSDPAALATFDDNWSALCDDIERAQSKSSLSDTDLALAYSTVHNVAILAEGFSELQGRSELLGTALFEEFDRIFSKLSIDDVSPHSTSQPRRSSHIKDPLPPYNSAAYDWLTKNINNPYPSTTIRKALAASSRTTARFISDWLKTVRKSIGWLRWCKAHCQGSRTLAVEVATHALSQNDATPTCSSEALEGFAAVCANLEGLYVVERYHTLDARYPTRSDKDDTRLLSNPFVDIDYHDIPPRCSPTPSLVSWSSDESENDANFPDLCHMDLPTPLTDHGPQRNLDGQKQPSTEWSFVDAEVFRPLPPLTTKSPLELCVSTSAPQENEQPIQTRLHSVTTATRSSRKRRLSDPGEGVHKRLRYPPAIPRLQAVSDFLPRVEAEDIFSTDTFLNVFDIPLPHPPSTSLEPLGPLQIEPFTGWDSLTSNEGTNNDIFAELLDYPPPLIAHDVAADICTNPSPAPSQSAPLSPSYIQPCDVHFHGNSPRIPENLDSDPSAFLSTPLLDLDTFAAPDASSSLIPEMWTLPPLSPFLPSIRLTGPDSPSDLDFLLPIPTTGGI